MRPRAIQGVPGLAPQATPFERFTQFAQMIAAVPKSEVGNSGKKSGTAGPKRKSQKRRSAMSEKLLKNLQELSDSIRDNSAQVERKLSSNGSKLIYLTFASTSEI